ncbi:MAG TPA: GAF domain-containing protein [Methylomirabilota bacterium]|nr:GAF domain-containing protein [Methylomirabilota bacterium]
MRFGRLQPYGLAVGASVAAFLLSRLLEPLIDPTEFPLFLGAVMLSAWYGGLGPGLLATALGIATGFSFFVPATPLGELSWNTWVRLGVFLVEALVVSGLTGALRASQARAEALVARTEAARAEVETAARRIQDLQQVTDAALAHLRLDDLLPELIRRIRQTLPADTVVILLLSEDEQELLVRAAYGLEQEVREGVRIPVGRGIAGQIAARREPIILENLSQVEISSPVLRAKGLQSLLGVPLMVEGRVIGVVHVGTLRPRSFTDDDTRLLRLVADRIALAIDHARLYEAAERARAAAEAAERRFRLLVDGVPDYAAYLVDREYRIASWNAGAERMKGYRDDEIMGQPFARFYPDDEVRRGAAERALAGAAAEGRWEEEGWRVRKDGSRFWASVLVTAMRDGAGRLLGFSVISHDLTERRRAASTRARLLDQVIAAQEEERRRVARELHDETGQSLTSLLVGLRTVHDADTLEAARVRAAELREITARTLAEVRRLAWGLHPSALDELGLVAALEHHAAEYTQAHGIVVDVEAWGLDGQRLPAPVERALYRILQEALTNAARHARAQKVSVVIQRHPAWVQVIVADDGCGFDVEAALRAAGAAGRLGLHGMRERAALLEGSVTIESTPGEGTTVYVRVPLASEPPREHLTGTT